MNKNALKLESEKKPDDIKPVTPSDQVTTQTTLAAQHPELEMLQQELKGKIRANDHNIKEIVDKI